MKNKNFLLSLMLAFLPLITWAHDFSAPNAEGKIIYYNITSEIEPYTVEVTYQGKSTMSSKTDIPTQSLSPKQSLMKE